MLPFSITETSLAMNSSLVMVILTRFHVSDCMLSRAVVTAAVIVSSRGLPVVASISGVRMPAKKIYGRIGTVGSPSAWSFGGWLKCHRLVLSFLLVLSVDGTLHQELNVSCLGCV